MTKGTFVTCAERREMQSMRDAGHPIPLIALAFDRCRQTVSRHTAAKKKRPIMDGCNDYLLKITKGRSRFEREMIARRFGLAGVKSLEVTLSIHRRKLREQASAQGVAA